MSRPHLFQASDKSPGHPGQYSPHQLILQPVKKDKFHPLFRVVVKREFILPPEQVLLGEKGEPDASIPPVLPFRLPWNPDHLSASVLGLSADGKCGKSFTQ